MQQKHAEQIAELLNTRNQLVVKYDASRVIGQAQNYLCEHDETDSIIGCVELKKIQWYQFEVSHLTTAPQAEGKGIGRKLLSRAEDRARKQGALILQCTIRDSNKRSQELFKRAGFKKVADFLYPQSGNIVGIWQRVLSTPN